MLCNLLDKLYNMTLFSSENVILSYDVAVIQWITSCHK